LRSIARTSQSTAGERDAMEADEALLELLPPECIALSGQLRLPIDDIPIQRKETVDQRDAMGGTPLHYACSVGNAHAVRLLVQHGANRHGALKDGRTALDLCSNRVVRRVLVPLSDAVAAACRDEGDTGSMGMLGRTSRLEALLRGVGQDGQFNASVLGEEEQARSSMAAVNLLLSTGEEINRGAGVQVRTVLH